MHQNWTAATAPGGPGTEGTWAAAAKEAVGAAYGGRSRVWFSIANAVVTEIFYPEPDCPCTRSLCFLLTDGQKSYAEADPAAKHTVSWIEPGVPAFRVSTQWSEYRITKEVVTDPSRDLLLLRVTLEGPVAHAKRRLFVILEPQLANTPSGNTGWVGTFKGVPMLMAQNRGLSLALACSAGWNAASAGYRGGSDPRDDIRAHLSLTRQYPRAEDGNVVLAGEIPAQEEKAVFLLALGFAATPESAGHHARAGLLRDFDAALAAQKTEWQERQARLEDLSTVSGDGGRLYRASTAVLHLHESKRFPGGIVASLSTPWGTSCTGSPGGYHVAWTRDLVEAVGGLIAAGAKDSARRVLGYLAATQEPDGHWSQNMWLNGTPYWTGIQLDEVGFPILLTDRARRDGVLSDGDLARLWPMVRSALSFLVRNGPVTQEDRWEHDGGYSSFTLAVEISALLAGAEFAEIQNAPETARYLRETADNWNGNIERWTYLTDTETARAHGVDGYYVRIAPAQSTPAQPKPEAATSRVLSPDVLALVRFGLRAPDDPKILNTLKIIDATLKADTPLGPAWHRYTGDTYGEQADGGPFEIHAHRGLGRAWPLLTGERAHYELAAGHIDAAKELMRALERFAGESALLPEQVWDSKDLPEKQLSCGGPTGSARPLVWAHAEYVKLLRSIRDGCLFDSPPYPRKRYIKQDHHSHLSIWRFNNKLAVMRRGTNLRIECLARARVRWTRDNWNHWTDSEAARPILGMWFVDIATSHLPPGTRMQFTFYWPEADKWEGRNFEVTIP